MIQGKFFFRGDDDIAIKICRHATCNTFFKWEKLFADRELHGGHAIFRSDRQEDTRCFHFGNE